MSKQVRWLGIEPGPVGVVAVHATTRPRLHSKHGRVVNYAATTQQATVFAHMTRRVARVSGIDIVVSKRYQGGAYVNKRVCVPPED